MAKHLAADGTVRDQTEQEQADLVAQRSVDAAEQVEASVAQVWQERSARETDPMYGISPIGAGVLLLGVQSGNAKAIAIQEWGRQLHAEATQREADIRAGVPVSAEWSTPRQKPFSISEISVELGL